MTQIALIPGAAPLAIEFSVAGEAMPQGSKTGYIINGMVVLVDVADKKTKKRKAGALKRWRASIAAKATAAFDGELWQGPIMLECTIAMPRSPSHFTSKGNLTKSAPMVPQKDLDKLLRAVGDALSKVVYRDDVQIVSFGASTKRFAKTRDGDGGVFVKVTRL